MLGWALRREAAAVMVWPEEDIGDDIHDREVAAHGAVMDVGTSVEWHCAR